MDGTLTAPLLNFAAIKAEMGIGNRHILEALDEMTPAQRHAAEQVLERHEAHAAAESTLNGGCIELVQWVEQRGIRTALITRNSRRSLQTVLDRHELRFDVLITREDRPYKPDPAPLRLACRRLELPPTDAWMVGDGQHDVEAGLAAGTRTVWVSHGQPRPFAARPWRTVRDLPELAGLLQQCGLNSHSPGGVRRV